MVEHVGRPLAVLGRPDQISFVNLQDIGPQACGLFPKDIGNCKRKLANVAVVEIQQRLGEHVRTCERKLVRFRGEHAAGRGGGQVERALTYRRPNDSRRLLAELHARLLTKILYFSAAKRHIYARQGGDKSIRSCPEFPGWLTSKRESSPSVTTSMPASSWVLKTASMASRSADLPGMASSQAGAG